MFSFRNLLFLTEGTFIDVQEDILVDLMGGASLPLAVSLSFLRSFTIHLWNVFMLSTFVYFQSIAGQTLKGAVTGEEITGTDVEVDVTGAVAITG